MPNAVLKSFDSIGEVVVRTAYSEAKEMSRKAYLAVEHLQTHPADATESPRFDRWFNSGNRTDPGNLRDVRNMLRNVYLLLHGQNITFYYAASHVNPTATACVRARGRSLADVLQDIKYTYKKNEIRRSTLNLDRTVFIFERFFKPSRPETDGSKASIVLHELTHLYGTGDEFQMPMVRRIVNTAFGAAVVGRLRANAYSYQGYFDEF